MMTVEALKAAVRELHWQLRRDVPRLSHIAWSDARNMTSVQTMHMMSCLEQLRLEVVRHIRFAETIVHPLIGQAQGAGVIRQHLADHRVVGRALEAARKSAGAELRPALDDVAQSLARLFALETTFTTERCVVRRTKTARTKRRALVVESSPVSSELIVETLASMHIDAVEIAAPQLALDWLGREAAPDLVVAAQDLPGAAGMIGAGMSGDAMLRAMRRTPRLAGTPAILVVGRADDGGAPQVPHVRCVERPLKMEALAEAVRSALEDTAPTLRVSPAQGPQAVHIVIGGADGGKRPLVLIVDDDHAIREALKSVIADEGFDTMGAVDGADALRLLSSGKAKPALIVLDLMMPGMDGVALAYRLRADPAIAETPLLLFSANDHVARIAQEVGAVAHVKKPVDLDALVDVIEAAVPRRTDAVAIP